MKILLVSNSSWNIYNFRLGLISIFRQRGHEIFLASPIDEYLDKIESIYYNKIYPIEHLSARGKNPISDILLIWELKKIFQTCKPDLVLLFTIKPNIYGGIVSRFLQIPYVVNITGLGSQFTSAAGFGKLVHILFSFSLKKCSLAFFHNQEDLDYFVSQNLLVSEQAAVVNGSGVDVQKFCAEPRETKDRLVFLFAGRLLREKGLAEFVQAAKKMKESGFAAIFHVIGPIETLELDVELRNIFEVAVRQGTIQYFNKTENVKPYLQAADIFVLPTYREGRSKAILEAMAMKMPVITCDVAGCRGLVVDGINGFLVKERDSDSLYLAMVKMCGFSYEMLDKMGEESRRIVVDQYELKKVQTQYLQVLEEHIILR
ncbi:MAG: glycosyltransferase family 4 protein [Saprospiraceae bacterium]|nr:glycosyltransferase family 4 protein [Candidatus Vicinibacter affinis]